MLTPSDHELISASLDGELTADEQQRVEALLAREPAARALLDELRALSGTLQALPRQRVEKDLSQSILRRAERAMLAAAPAASATATNTPTEDVAARSHRASDNGYQSPGETSPGGSRDIRSIVWPLLAVAAALLLLASPWNRPADEEPRVALHESDDANTGTPDAVFRAAPEAGQSPSSFAGSAKPSDKSFEEHGKLAKSASPTSGQDRALRLREPRNLPAGAVPRKSFGEEKQVAAGKRAMPRPEAADGSAVGGGGPVEDAQSVDAVASAAQQRQPANQFARRNDALNRGMDNNLALKQADRDRQPGVARAGRPLSDEMDLLVVEIDVTDYRQAQQAFDHLLARNDIAWRDEFGQPLHPTNAPQRFGASTATGDFKTAEVRDRLGDGGAVPPAAGQTSRDKETELAAKTNEEPAGEQRLPNQQSEQVRQSLAQGHSLGFGSAPADAVYVEAPAAQVEATLAGLARDPQAFVRFSVDRPPAARGLARQLQSQNKANRQSGGQATEGMPVAAAPPAASDAPASTPGVPGPAVQPAPRKSGENDNPADKSKKDRGRPNATPEPAAPLVDDAELADTAPADTAPADTLPEDAVPADTAPKDSLADERVASETETYHYAEASRGGSPSHGRVDGLPQATAQRVAVNELLRATRTQQQGQAGEKAEQQQPAPVASRLDPTAPAEEAPEGNAAPRRKPLGNSAADDAALDDAASEGAAQDAVHRNARDNGAAGESGENPVGEIVPQLDVDSTEQQTAGRKELAARRAQLAAPMRVLFVFRVVPSPAADPAAPEVPPNAAPADTVPANPAPAEAAPPEAAPQ